MYNPKGTLLDTDSLVFALSDEELTLITAAMNIPTFLGYLPPVAMPGEAATAGERSLRARGLAEISPENGGTLVFAADVARLISVCAVPTHAIVILSDFPDGGMEDPYRPDGLAKAHFFCLTGDDLVYHNRATPGLHTFTTIAEPDTMKMLMAAILEAEDPTAQPDAPRETYQVDRQSLVAAEGMLESGGPSAVYDRLFNDLNAPHSLARALSNHWQFVFSLLWRNDWQAKDYAYTANTQLLDSGFFVVPAEEGGLWIYTFEGENPLMAVFNPVSAEEFIDEMVNRLHVTMGQA